jgi:hypothetical protein
MYENIIQRKEQCGKQNTWLQLRKKINTTIDIEIMKISIFMDILIPTLKVLKRYKNNIIKKIRKKKKKIG